MKKKLRWVLMACVIVLMTVLWIWQPWKAAPKKTRNGPATARVSLENVVHTILATGKVMPQVGAEVNVGARISGRLDKLYVNVGDTVGKGQIIAEIEKEDLEATTAEKEAEVALVEARLEALKREGPQEIAQKEAELAERKAKLEFVRCKLGRDDQLLKKALISNEDWEETSSDFKAAQAQYEVAQRKLQLANTNFDEGLKQLAAELRRTRASLKNALVKLSYAAIHAPLSGVVGSVSTREGETVAAGLSAPTFVTIVDLKRLQLDAYVDEVDIGRVKVGQKGFFSVDAFPGKEFHGRVTAIYPQAVIQNDVVTYDCIISIDTPYDGLLRPQMTATVTIMVANKENVLVLPVGAVKHRAGQNVVWRRKGDRIEEVSVTTGWQDDTRVEVLSGLSEGEVVLLSPPTDFK
ncbi:efflux RND transporter periplasmic adaptor subunit [Desulfosarcina ovata]|uniref:efflux RND transporter periplasmic adaptor subunit n=1 Tax=Desulfosarcina ovata TaxID=83564 RepID=UPI0012D33C25|nr:efflux RND transporter periplasmic adaptor subunit [Desulfosarcina ovata]